MTEEQFFTFDKGEERKKLTFPKGKVQFQHYSRSGLFVEDLEREDVDKQELELKVILREWNNTDPSTNGKPFDVDSCELVMKELIPEATKEGKRASRIYLHAKTSEAESAEHGSCLLIEDFVDGDKPAHIYQDDGGGGGASWDTGSEDLYEQAVDDFFSDAVAMTGADSAGSWKEEAAKVKFPKGKVELKHYTLSGLYLWDNEQIGEDKHSPRVELRLNAWEDEKPAEELLAKFYARDNTSEKDKEAVVIGFIHEKKETGFSVTDSNDGKDDYELETVIHHRGLVGGSDTTYLSIKDKDTDGKDIKIELKHKAKDYLLIESSNETDVEYKLNHHEDAGLKIWNTGGDTQLEIYHASGAKVLIEQDGTITASSPKKLIGKAPEISLEGESKIAGKAPNIELEGEVKITGNVKLEGDLEVTGNIKFGGEITGPNGNWHVG